MAWQLAGKNSMNTHDHGLRNGFEMVIPSTESLETWPCQNQQLEKFEN